MEYRRPLLPITQLSPLNLLPTNSSNSPDSAARTTSSLACVPSRASLPPVPSPPMTHKRILTLALSAIGAIPAMAAEPLDIWQTTFKCGGRTLILASRCRAAAEPMALNDCQPGQTLSNGVTRISLPHASPAKGAPAVFAVAWSCVSVLGRPYVALSYASGQGRGEGDESAEVFDLDLQAIRDHAVQVAVFRQEAKRTRGRVRSIFPEN